MKYIKLFTLVYLLLPVFSCNGQETENTRYSTAPEGAIILFDGTDFSHWTNCDGGEVRWKIVNGVMEVVPDSTWGCEKIQGTMTKQLFKDFQLHIEFKLPDNENTNSGVYIQKRYEIQINNSFESEFDPGMGGSIYRQKVPDVIVGKPSGEWETYDILFRSARFDPDHPEIKIDNARISVIHNGVVIHNNVIIKTKTGVGYPEGNEPGPIMLQDHLALVQFRNIWIIPNAPIESLSPTVLAQAATQKNTLLKGNVGGYLITQREKVNESFNAGYSMYVAAYPLLREYPGREFQSGLFGTWMHPQYDKPLPVEKLYTDIEGGLGWWRDTEYATATPKFIMGGVQRDFVGWANGPGAGQGRDWDNPKGKYGVAQLSPWVLWPPDGLNLKQGTCGELFGSGYLPLPLTEPKSTTAGKEVSTGNQCWTLFLNTANFKGPVAFFTPYFWTKASVEDPRLDGLFLDQRPSEANKPFQMETQHIHSFEATDSKGQRYARMAPTQYPAGPDGNTELLHRLMVYNKKALWDEVEAWFKGGEPSDGRIDVQEAAQQKFKKGIRSNWKFYGTHIPKDKRALMNITDYLDQNITDAATLSVRWDGDLITKKETRNGYVITLPEYYKFVKTGNDTIGEWVAVAPGEVPDETGLHTVDFSNKVPRNTTAYVTPDDVKSCWKNPGPVAGPFKAKLGDGSTVTYYWYRFADQPALLNADMTREEREEMQRRVELLHRNWTKEREYLPSPLIGKLAEIDPALILTPPKGLEIGYVPIVTKQGIE